MALVDRSANGVLSTIDTENLPVVSLHETSQAKMHAAAANLAPLADNNNSCTAINNNNNNNNGANNTNSNEVLQPLKTPKQENFEHNDQENSACKRRLEYSANVNMALHRTNKTNSMQRRNARERNRVRYLNMTFEVLRRHLPEAAQPKSKNKKMSKVDTLRGAIEYIRDLQEMLEENDAVDAALKGCDPSQPFIDSELLSPGGSLSPSGSPNTISEDGVSTSEEDDLLDVHNWFAC